MVMQKSKCCSSISSTRYTRHCHG